MHGWFNAFLFDLSTMRVRGRTVLNDFLPYFSYRSFTFQRNSRTGVDYEKESATTWPTVSFVEEIDA